MVSRLQPYRTLLSIDISFLVYKFFNYSFVSFFILQMIIFIIFNAIRAVLGRKIMKFKFLKTKEQITKLFENLYEKTNSYLDTLRDLILLKNIPLLINHVIIYCFFIIVGGWFSLITLIVLSYNFYFVYGNYHEMVMETAEKTLNTVKTKLDQTIPKYVEEAKKE